jgi:hypothetical protein
LISSATLATFDRDRLAVGAATALVGASRLAGAEPVICVGAAVVGTTAAMAPVSRFTVASLRSAMNAVVV